MKIEKRCVLLRLPGALIDEVDEICHALGEMNRSAWLTRAIRRQVHHSLLKEVNLFANPEIRRALER
jgi:hypothetical protein